MCKKYVRYYDLKKKSYNFTFAVYLIMRSMIYTYFRWNDECPGMKIVSAVAVRSKVYSLQMIPHIKRNLKRCKGVKRHVIRKTLRHEDFLDRINKYINFYSINSKKHRLSTFKKTKLGLSGFYDKKFVLHW